jgi:hypothetical protein
MQHFLICIFVFFQKKVVTMQQEIILHTKAAACKKQVAAYRMNQGVFFAPQFYVRLFLTCVLVSNVLGTCGFAMQKDRKTYVFRSFLYFDLSHISYSCENSSSTKPSLCSSAQLMLQLLQNRRR